MERRIIAEREKQIAAESSDFKKRMKRTDFDEEIDLDSDDLDDDEY